MTMRHPLLASAIVLTLGSVPAWAQLETGLKQSKQMREIAQATPTDEGEDESAAPQGGPVEGSVQVEPSPPSPTGDQTHTVNKGDTLWDLSQKYLGSPWYWPKVWSYNPEIANPHWIYPGNQVRFLPTGEEVPTQVEVGTGPEDVAPVPMIEEDKVQVSGKIGYTPKNAITVRMEGFVTAKEVEEAGVIAGSFAESQMLSFPQQLYVRFKKAGAVKMGDPYIIYRTVTELSHPINGSDFGFLTHIAGTARVVRWSDKEKVATLEIVKNWDEMSRGDLVGPAGENTIKSLAPKANSKEVKDGVVVGGVRYWFSTFGEHEQLLVDKGADNGVEPGNVFTIYRHYDGMRSILTEVNTLDTQWPKEDVGTCMAIEVKAKATNCILLRSIREIMAGDRVEMRVSGGGASASR